MRGGQAHKEILEAAGTLRSLTVDGVRESSATGDPAALVHPVDEQSPQHGLWNMDATEREHHEPDERPVGRDGAEPRLEDGRSR